MVASKLESSEARITGNTLHLKNFDSRVDSFEPSESQQVKLGDEIFAFVFSSQNLWSLFDEISAN